MIFASFAALREVVFFNRINDFAPKGLLRSERLVMELTAPIFDWSTIGSLLLTGGTGIIVLMAAIFSQSIRLHITITLTGLLAALVYSATLWGTGKTGFGGMVIISSFTLVLDIRFFSPFQCHGISLYRLSSIIYKT